MHRSHIAALALFDNLKIPEILKLRKITKLHFLCFPKTLSEQRSLPLTALQQVAILHLRKSVFPTSGN